jgi:hypothetical protein
MLVRRRTSPLKRYATRLVLATALSVTFFLTGWQIQRHLLSGNGAVSPPASADDSHTEARKTVAAVNAATVEEARAMPPVSPASVANGVGALRRLGASGPLAPAQLFSLRCHEDAANLGTWDALDMCAAFDHAVFMQVARDKTASADYFIDRHDRAAHQYVPNVSSMDAIALRLDRIRELVTPAPDRRLHVRRPGWCTLLRKAPGRLRTRSDPAPDLQAPCPPRTISDPRAAPQSRNLFSSVAGAPPMFW